MTQAADPAETVMQGGAIASVSAGDGGQEKPGGETTRASGPAWLVSHPTCGVTIIFCHITSCPETVSIVIETSEIIAGLEGLLWIKKKKKEGANSSAMTHWLSSRSNRRAGCVN